VSSSQATTTSAQESVPHNRQGAEEGDQLSLVQSITSPVTSAAPNQTERLEATVTPIRAEFFRSNLLHHKHHQYANWIREDSQKVLELKWSCLSKLVD